MYTLKQTDGLPLKTPRTQIPAQVRNHSQGLKLEEEDSVGLALERKRERERQRDRERGKAKKRS